MYVLSLLNWSATYLSSCNIANARSESEFLLSGLLGCSKINLYLNKKPLAESKERVFRQLIRKRGRHIPLQILLGNAQFMNWSFLVRKGVFIPRIDSEILVEETEWLIKRFSPVSKIKILDLGTGSGNIAISLAKRFSDTYLYATDISSNALHLAKKNAEVLGVKKQVCFRQGDLFFALKKDDYAEKFFMITANLPYIPKSLLSSLPVEVKNFDPIQGLNGGKNGLVLYQRLLLDAWRYLQKKGFVILEIGEQQAKELRKLAEVNKKYEFIKVIKNYQGQERVIVFRNK